MKKNYLQLIPFRFAISACFIWTMLPGCSSARLATQLNLPDDPKPLSESKNETKTEIVKPIETPSDSILNYDAAPDKVGEAEKPTSNAKHEPSDDLHKLIIEMSEKIQSLETKLTSMNDKMDAQKFNLSLLTHPNQGKAMEVAEVPANNAGAPPEEAAPIPYDPEAGITQDTAIQTFRKSLVLFQGMKLPEATLAFSDFLEKNPDHALAGSAQFYIAESYMKQKEYKLAIQEYQKILTTYDRSVHVSDALRQLSIAEDILKQGEDAARHRQLLTSLYPTSPAASGIENLTDPAPPREPPVTIPPKAVSTEHTEHTIPSETAVPPPTAPIEDRS